MLSEKRVIATKSDLRQSTRGVGWSIFFAQNLFHGIYNHKPNPKVALKKSRNNDRKDGKSNSYSFRQPSRKTQDNFKKFGFKPPFASATWQLMCAEDPP